MADPTIILDIEPEWSDEPSVTYSFLTAIQETPYLVEQRRPLLPESIIGLGYKFVGSGGEIQRLRNILLAAKAELLCTPIFSEPIITNSIVTGGSSITALTDLSYFWNIKNCTYAVLIDLLNGQSEMLGLSSVSGQLIRFKTTIIKTWVASRTVVYPAVAALLRSITEADLTDNMTSIQVEFEEAVIGEESVKKWVGLDEKSCYPCLGQACSLGISPYLRITLRWGVGPLDLDAHFTGPTTPGPRFHCYYFNKLINSGTICSLSLDDVSSFGPETITLTQQISGVYRFSIHDYSGRSLNPSSNLGNSQATVEICAPGGGVWRMYSVPNLPGTLWTVFELSGTTLTTINTMSYHESPSTIP
jgi:hypothetical protein